MYRQGLGDCFLLTFDVGAGADRERHVLIDCGTLGAKTTGVKIAQVLQSIRDTTGGHLDLLVATHEHADHVSGFRSQREIFEDFTIDHVWLAWTENPEDELAKTLATNRNDLGQALTALAQAPSATDVALQVRDLLGFFGDDAGGGAGESAGAGLGVLAAADFAKTVNEAMEFVRAGMGAAAEYRTPGEAPLEPDWLPGFRIYVLGPPKNTDRLGEMGEHGSEHLYGLGAGLRAAGLRAAGIGAARTASAAFAGTGAAERGAAARGEKADGADGVTALEEDECEREMPFDRRFRKQPAEAWAWYGGYFARANEWRSIDQDWLRVAADLALQLDSMTNNTSLAVAVERIADGKVLLFPADAQQGNWLSWHDADLKWAVRGPGGAGPARQVTAADLLRRTVFYKVGHHGSHNATVNDQGLELMGRQGDLTAFIPLDRAVALSRNPKGSWKMPARNLYRRLLEKCRGRVVRSDLGWAADAATAEHRETEEEFDQLATKAEWTEWKKAQAAAEAAERVVIDPLFVDYTLK